MAAEPLLGHNLYGALLGQDDQLGFHGNQFWYPQTLTSQVEVEFCRGN